MAALETNAEALALQALVWTLGEPSRASRLLDLTGLDPSELRARAGDPSLLSATLGFLESYEPDLIACADALAVKPAALVSARAQLERT
ncbi:MAG: DUF3572 domain-containing protein [Pseudomonadota bacterium]